MPKPGKNKESEEATALLLDMPGVKHLVPPSFMSTHEFYEYTSMHLLPFLEKEKSGNSTQFNGMTYMKTIA